MAPARSPSPPPSPERLLRGPRLGGGRRRVVGIPHEEIRVRLRPRVLLAVGVLSRSGLVVVLGKRGNHLGRRGDDAGSTPVFDDSNDGLVWWNVLRGIARRLPAGRAAAGPARVGRRVRGGGLVAAGRLGERRVRRRGAGAGVGRRDSLAAAELHDGVVVERGPLYEEVLVVFAVLQLFPLVLEHLLVVVVRYQQRRRQTESLRLLESAFRRMRSRTLAEELG